MSALSLINKDEASAVIRDSQNFILWADHESGLTWFNNLCVDTVRPIVSVNRDLPASSAASDEILSHTQSPSDVNIRHPAPATPFISVLVRSAYGASPHSHVTLTTPYRRASLAGSGLVWVNTTTWSYGLGIIEALKEVPRYYHINMVGLLGFWKFIVLIYIEGRDLSRATS